MKIRHYTIAYFDPVHGGTETVINDYIKIINGEHIILCKTGTPDGATVNGVRSYSVTKNGSWGCHKILDSYKKYSCNIPEFSWEFSPDTIDIIKNINPDILIIYGGDCNSMSIPLFELNGIKKIYRIQAFKDEEVDIYKMADQVWMPDKESFDIESKKYNNINLVYMPQFYDDSIFNSEEREDYCNRKIIYVGRFSPEKRPDHIIKIYDKIKEEFHDVELSMYGGFNDIKYYSYLLDLINNSKNKPNISNSFIDHISLSKIYKKTDIVVIPSKYETFSCVALEAMACGCTIVSNCSNVHLLNNEKKGGLLSWAKKYIVNGLDYGILDDENFSSVEGFYLALKSVLSGGKPIDSCEFVKNTYSYSKNKEFINKILGDLK